MFFNNPEAKKSKLLADIEDQIVDLKNRIENLADKENPAEVLYKKLAVTEAVKGYVKGEKDKSDLSLIVQGNPEYDAGRIGRSATGKLLDRALKLNGEKLDLLSSVKIIFRK